MKPKKSKKKTYTWEMRLKEKDDGIVESYQDIITWYECRHCKKTNFIGRPEIIGALKGFLDEMEKDFKKLRKSKDAK